jgi:hypothetical protein
LHGKIESGNRYVFQVRIFLAYPIPTIPGNKAGLVVGFVLLENYVPQVGGRIEHTKVVVYFGKVIVGGFAYAQHIVDPGQVAVRSGASELRGKLDFLKFGIELPRPFSDFIRTTDILDVNALGIIYEEDGNFTGMNDLLYLVFALI